MNAVIYARYSSHNQREESIEGQIRECTAYAKSNNMIIVGEYIDRAISGRTADRPSFQKLIRDSDKHQFDAVIVYTLDRFARNRYDSAVYKNKLKKNGVRVYYAKQPISDSPEGIILESVLEGYAEYYSENLSRNIKRGLTENAMQCKINGGATARMLGYAMDSEKHLIVNPDTAPIVRKIFEMYSSGSTTSEIVSYLNEKGYKTAQGKPFGKNSLYWILRNEKYIGVYKYGEIVVEGGVPAIVDKETFNRVQKLLELNHKNRKHKKTDCEYLLTGKLFCGHCGASMIGESGKSKSGKVYHYYKCANRKAHKNCDKKPERKEWIERIVTEFTINEFLTDEMISEISERTARLVKKEFRDNSHLKILENELKDIQSKIENILRAIESGVVTPSVTERLTSLENERDDVLGKIAQEKITKPTIDKEHIEYWLESFRKGDIESIEYQRKIIDALVNSVYVYDGEDRRVVIAFNISGDNKRTLTCSDIAQLAPPNVAIPNTPICTENCVIFTIKIERE